MPLEIIRTVSHTDQIHVYPGPDGCTPTVGISAGLFFVHIKPHEARELAHALIEAADAATSPAREVA